MKYNLWNSRNLKIPSYCKHNRKKNVSLFDYENLANMKFVRIHLIMCFFHSFSCVVTCKFKSLESLRNLTKWNLIIHFVTASSVTDEFEFRNRLPQAFSSQFLRITQFDSVKVRDSYHVSFFLKIKIVCTSNTSIKEFIVKANSSNKCR